MSPHNPDDLEARVSRPVTSGVINTFGDPQEWVGPWQHLNEKVIPFVKPSDHAAAAS